MRVTGSVLLALSLVVVLLGSAHAQRDQDDDRPRRGRGRDRDRQASSDDDLQKIISSFGELVNLAGRRKILILVDEVQHLDAELQPLGLVEVEVFQDRQISTDRSGAGQHIAPGVAELPLGGSREAIGQQVGLAEDVTTPVRVESSGARHVRA